MFTGMNHMDTRLDPLQTKILSVILNLIKILKLTMPSSSKIFCHDL